MLRFLQFLLVLVFARILWGALRMILARPRPAGSGEIRSGTALVRCDRCGVHAPAERIRRVGDANLCSRTCAGGE